MVKVGDGLTRAGGLQLAAVGVLMSAVLFTAFRRWERWAWYAMWTLPAWSLGVFLLMLSIDRAAGVPPPPPLISGPIFAVVSAALLLAVAPRFFAEPGART